MTRLLFSVLLLCVTAWGGTISPILDQFPQLIQGQNGSGTCVFTSNVTSGDTMLVGAHSEGALTTPTDSLTTTWTLVDSNTATTAKAYVWKGVAGSSGAETITLTGTVSFPRSTCLELPPSIGSTVDDHTNGSFANGTTTFTTSAMSTTVNGDFLFFYVGNDCSNCRTVSAAPLIPIEFNGGDSEAAGWGFAGVNGSYSTSFTATAGNLGYVAMSLKPAAIILDTVSLPSGALTNSYSYCLQARGGTGAYTWSISSGSLPSGLSLNGSTGCVTGTPTAGSSTPTFRVTDGTNSTTRALLLTINNSATATSFIQAAAGVSSAILTSVNAGDCIVVSSPIGFAAITLVYPTDSLGTVYKLVNGALGTTGGVFLATNYLFVGVAPSSGADTVSSHSTLLSTMAAQFRNCQVFGDAASAVAGFNVGVATVTGNPIVTPAPNSMIWAAYQGAATSGPGSTANAGAGYTADITSNPNQGEHQSVAAAGSTPVTFAQTANADGSWVINGIALRPLTSGPVATGVRRHKTPIF